MHDGPITTFLFTDIEGSTRLWEEQPERMREALARHDALARAAVERHGGRVVKMTGDGLHAAFADPVWAVAAALRLQLGMGAMERDGALALRVRCGMHAGVHQPRDDDFYGSEVNRAARIMSAAHGGQVLLSQAVAALTASRLPDGVALRDLGRVRLRDLSVPEHLFQLVHPELRAQFPPLRSLERTPHNLPLEVNSFVGRERDVERVRTLVGRGRLVTITGMGGLGKTRLMLHVAAEMQDEFPDGVWLAELADVSDERLVVPAVASVLRVKESPPLSLTDAIVEHLSSRRVLLLLDNCEHLLEACAGLGRRLLAAAPGVRIVATSREPLRASGESVYLLSALEVPNLRAPFEPQVLMQNEAARLFVERARDARADFELTHENAADLASICHRLDGIPLALELAAARVRTLPIGALAERLSDRFKVLRAGDRTASPRQQTLQALIDWSYELLTPQERLLLQQLSVFAGGWTLEAAEAVCECAGEDVVDILSRLVEKSLVVHEAASGRYRLLETVRQYAHQRLLDSGWEGACRSRHLRYFVGFAESAHTSPGPGESPRWMEALDDDLDNIVSALSAWEGGATVGDARLRLANAMKRYWFHRGLLQLGLQSTLNALGAGAQSTPDPVRNRAVFLAGQLYHLMGRYADARSFMERALAAARELGDESAIPALLQSVGMAAQGQGDLNAARARLEEALEIARQGGDARRIASAMNALAQLELAAGFPSAARELLSNVVELSRGAGDAEATAIGLLNLAITAIHSNAPSEAAHLLRTALPIAAQVGSTRIEQSLLEVCAGLAAAREEAARAARFYGAAESQARRTGLRRDPADEAFLAPLISRARRELGQARFDSEAAEGSRLDASLASAEARSWLLSSPA